MPITANKCFGTVKKLKTFEPGLLCRALSEFPADLKRARVALPAAEEADFENMPYDALVSMVLKGEMSDELDELLFNVSSLGNADGWTNLVREARYGGYKIDECSPGQSLSGCALSAWLNDWPNNRELLEKAMARMQLYKLTSYVYYPMVEDLRHEYREPGGEDVRRLAAELGAHFESLGHGKGTRVHTYDFDDEIWFMVRYPGRLQFMQTYTDEEEGVKPIVPAKFDAVVYDKKHGFLRMSLGRLTDHRKYRMALGHLLFKKSNVFVEDMECVTLEPLKGESLGIFDCEDMKWIREVDLLEVCFDEVNSNGRTVTWKWNGGEDASLNRVPLFSYVDGKKVHHPKHVVSPGTDHIHRAVFRYTVRNKGGRRDKLTVHSGNQLRYARESDSAKIGEWMIGRRILNVGDLRWR